MPEKVERYYSDVGEMTKRREVMEDGRRYIIYYTFGAEKKRLEGEIPSVEIRSGEREDV
jgi:hypothetical protein